MNRCLPKPLSALWLFVMNFLVLAAIFSLHPLSNIHCLLTVSTVPSDCHHFHSPQLPGLGYSQEHNVCDELDEVGPVCFCCLAPALSKTFVNDIGMTACQRWNSNTLATTALINPFLSKIEGEVSPDIAICPSASVAHGLISGQCWSFGIRIEKMNSYQKKFSVWR